jgi:hypothetical protein
MMDQKIIRYTLLTDGTSDEALIPIIDWTIEQNFPGISYASQHARDLGPVGHDLQVRFDRALTLFPCEIMFVHRDAESVSLKERNAEIIDSLKFATRPYIPVIPVRMTEAWMLSDASAIRAAAGNKNSIVGIDLPKKDRWEKLVNPKEELFQALTHASEKTGRALKKFFPVKHRYRVAQLTEDFDKLRGLISFDAFEKSIVSEFHKLIEV